MWLQASHNAEELKAAFDAHVPMPRGAALVDERLVALSFNEAIPNHLMRTFRLENTAQTVLRFYRDELGEAGWSSGPTGYVEHAMSGTSNWFAHRKICFAIGVYVPPSTPTDEFSIRLERGMCQPLVP
jgi:hypothetical protein